MHTLHKFNEQTAVIYKRRGFFSMKKPVVCLGEYGSSVLIQTVLLQQVGPVVSLAATPQTHTGTLWGCKKLVFVLVKAGSFV